MAKEKKDSNSFDVVTVGKPVINDRGLVQGYVKQEVSRKLANEQFALSSDERLSTWRDVVPEDEVNEWYDPKKYEQPLRINPAVSDVSSETTKSLQKQIDEQNKIIQQLLEKVSQQSEPAK